MTKAGKAGAGLSRLEPLFFGIKPSDGVKLEPVFRMHGLESGVFELRGMSRPPNPLLPPNLEISLRALIGVNVRVEVILFLAGSPAAAHASEIARATGYAPRTMQTVLREMLISGHLLTQEPAIHREVGARRGANRRYHVQPEDWAFLTAGKPLPQWTPWTALLTLARCVLTAIPAPGLEAKHPAVVSSQLRHTLSVEGQALAAAGLLPQLDLRPDAPGTELLETLSARLGALLANL
jgi:hypothetical protein